ncbi:MAG: carbohydrate binding family 9 domain-containing protein [Betaproteobacteria bacterium]|nr:carbohydrate binding family 9 domain-containing protein [Betaproteobacteria bacterium]
MAHIKNALSRVTRIFALVSLLSPAAHALEAVKLTTGESFKLDGRLDEGFWSRAKPADKFHDWLPRDNTPSPFPTEVRFAFDGEKLYVGIHAKDPNPSLIRAPFVRRDKVMGDQDFVGVLIDPVGSKKFAQFFRVSANGLIADGLFNDANTSEDFSPDFDYEGAAQLTADGWTAEMAIPFSSLRYRAGDAQRWNVLILRGTTREQLHRAAQVAIPRDWNCLVCYAEPLTGLVGLPATNPLSVVPQFTVASRRDTIKGRANIRENDVKAGVDVKFRPRADTVIDATLNPDFSQVELDTPQLTGNSQFALFFTEKRPFFLEGADLFDAPVNLIYTRSITDPAWGARATQRNEGLEYTVLTAKDDGKGLVLLPNPLGTNFARQDRKSQATFSRARAHVTDEVTLGGIITDRTYDGAGHNRVASADVVWRPNAEQRLRAQLGQSWTTALPDANGRLAQGASRNDHSAFVDWFHNGVTWNHYLQYEEMGKDFRADNGFISQSGFREVVYEGRYKLGTPFGFNEFNIFLNANRKLDIDGRVLYQQANPGISIGASRATFFTFEYRPNQLVRVANDGVPRKRDQVFFAVESQPANWLPYVYAEIARGDRVDVANNRIGKGVYFGANARLRPTNRIEIEPRIDDAWIDSIESTQGGKRIIHERALQMLGIYHLNAQDSLRVIWQRSFVKRSPSLWNFPVTAADRQQTVSLVYAHRRSLNATIYLGATAGRSQEPDASFQRDQREVFAKVSWPLERLLSRFF